MSERHAGIATELERLRSESLPAAMRAMEEAQGQGDASQNPDSFLAAEEIAHINTRMAYLEDILSSGPHALPEGTIIVVDFGDGPEEMLLSAAPGRGSIRPVITFRSPLGEALADARAGDTVKVGNGTVHILGIRTP